MKNLFLSISLFFIIACKGNLDESNSIAKNNSIENEKNISLQNETTRETCEEIINKIVKSSNLDFRNQKEYLTQIDRIENNKITIHVYFENNLSENPKEKQIVESTIAWLELDINNVTLFNTTADPENPIELKFDKTILQNNNAFDICGVKKIIKEENKENLKYSILPFDFDDYYNTCVFASDSITCNKNYPRYIYKENDFFAKLTGKNYHPSDYIYLPRIKDYQPIILCNTETDVESYNLIIINNKKIISSLEIGIMDGQSIMQFNISKDYIITLYKRKNTNEKNKKYKTYMINKNGVISEIR